MRRFIRVNIRIFLDILSVALAFILYFSRKTIPIASQHAFVRLFCISAGKSNDFLSKVIGCIYPVRPLKGSCGVISGLTQDELVYAAAKLNNDGYYIFKERIPQEICDRLVNFSLKTPAALRPRDGEILNGNKLRYETYNPVQPRAVCYDFDSEHLISNVDIQNIFSDKSFVMILIE